MFEVSTPQLMTTFLVVVRKDADLWLGAIRMSSGPNYSLAGDLNSFFPYLGGKWLTLVLGWRSKATEAMVWTLVKKELQTNLFLGRAVKWWRQLSTRPQRPYMLLRPFFFFFNRKRTVCGELRRKRVGV